MNCVEQFEYIMQQHSRNTAYQFNSIQFMMVSKKAASYLWQWQTVLAFHYDSTGEYYFIPHIVVACVWDIMEGVES